MQGPPKPPGRRVRPPMGAVPGKDAVGGPPPEVVWTSGDHDQPIEGHHIHPPVVAVTKGKGVKRLERVYQ